MFCKSGLCVDSMLGGICRPAGVRAVCVVPGLPFVQEYFLPGRAALCTCMFGSSLVFWLCVVRRVGVGQPSLSALHPLLIQEVFFCVCQSFMPVPLLIWVQLPGAHTGYPY